MVKLLLDRNADVNARTNYGRTPLGRAARNGHTQIVQMLLFQYSKIPHQMLLHSFSLTISPLSFLVFSFFSFLISTLSNANANAATEGGETPLLMAATGNHKKIVKLLLEHDADVNATSAGFTAMRIATLQGYTDIVTLLQQYGRT